MNSINRRFLTALTALLCACFTSHPSWGAFNLVINPGPTLAGNAPALAAFNRAANQWAVRISNSITVTISADLAPLGAGIIGSSNSVTLQSAFNTVRNQLVTSSALESDDGIAASLPTAAQFTAALPPGKNLGPNLRYTKANGKAMGFTGLDLLNGTSDGTITFSSGFNFDYDNSDGVNADSIDFETAAAHEIGHILGFVSTVDVLDQATFLSTFSPLVLDLFRFNIANSPTGAADFATTQRDLTPGNNAVTDFGLDTWGIGTEFRMSTGVAMGDGRQASHWKADEFTGQLIGIFDPTLNFGTFEQLSEADFRALDLIGWNISPIPEPSTYTLGIIGLAALYLLRRKRGGSGT